VVEKPKKGTGPQIRVYVVKAGAKILGVKLNGTSATALVRDNPGSETEIHIADKRLPPK